MTSPCHARTRRHPLPTLATLLLVTTTGCAADLEERIGAYAAAVARVVGNDVHDPVRAQSTLPPRRRLVRFEVDTPTIGIFDLLSIQGCRLGELAGYRNSQMGRVMPPTRRLGYELEVLESGARCLEGLEPERKQRLATLLAKKREALERFVWNALWTTEEMEGLLAATQAPFARLRLADAIAPLRRIERRLAAGLHGSTDAARLESELASLRGAEPLGLPLRQLETLTRHLSAISALVAPHGAGGCAPTEVRLSGVFREHYLQAVQPDVARLDRSLGPMLEVLDALYRHSRGSLPLDPAVLDYHERVLSPSAPDGLWSRYRASLITHARAWEPTLRACDVLPSA